MDKRDSCYPVPGPAEPHTMSSLRYALDISPSFALVRLECELEESSVFVTGFVSEINGPRVVVHFVGDCELPIRSHTKFDGDIGSVEFFIADYPADGDWTAPGVTVVDWEILPLNVGTFSEKRWDLDKLADAGVSAGVAC